MLVVVIALAAALVGNFSSFPLTFLGGLLVGVLESEALHYGRPTGYLKGLSTAVPFLVIVVLLIVRGRALPLRSFLADRLPSIGTGTGTAGAGRAGGRRGDRFVVGVHRRIGPTW